MLFLILLLGLVALGVWNGAVVWYVLAGVLAGFWLVLVVGTLLVVHAAIKRVDREFGINKKKKKKKGSWL